MLWLNPKLAWLVLTLPLTLQNKEQYGRELAWLNPKVAASENRAVEIEGLVDQMNLKLSLLSSSHKKASEDIVELKVTYPTPPQNDLPARPARQVVFLPNPERKGPSPGACEVVALARVRHCLSCDADAGRQRGRPGTARRGTAVFFLFSPCAIDGGVLALSALAVSAPVAEPFWVVFIAGRFTRRKAGVLEAEQRRSGTAHDSILGFDISPKK